MKSKRGVAGFEVVGTAGLIQNCFAQKAIEQMLRKHMGLPIQKEPKIPEKCWEDATIRNENGAVCVPPAAFKAAMISASVGLKGLKKTHLRLQLFVVGQSIPIAYSKMTPRMDWVITSGMSRTPDVRFRPEFSDWSAKLVIQYADTLDESLVEDLLSRAGDVGVGEWRPEKNGSFGTFRVGRHLTEDEIEETRKACSVPLIGLKIPEWAKRAELTEDLIARLGKEAMPAPEDDDEGKEVDQD